MLKLFFAVYYWIDDEDFSVHRKSWVVSAGNEDEAKMVAKSLTEKSSDGIEAKLSKCVEIDPSDIHELGHMLVDDYGHDLE